MNGMTASTGPVFTSSAVGWAVDQRQLVETTDGGFGWTTVNLGLQAMAEFPMIRGVSVRSLDASGNDVLVYLSTLPREPEKITSKATSGKSQQPYKPNCLPASVPAPPASTAPLQATLNVSRCLHFECQFFALSLDAGKRWRFSGPLLPNDIYQSSAFAPSDPMVAFGNALIPGALDPATGRLWLQALYMSEDGGSQWVIVGIPQFQDIQVQAYSVVDVLNRQMAWGFVTLAASPGQACPPAGLHALVRTVDGGKQWSLMDNAVGYLVSQ